MYINRRIMAGQLHEDAVQHPPASSGDIHFTFSIRQNRSIKLADGTMGTATEYARCSLWMPASRSSFHADKLKKGTWVIVEGRHDVTKRQKDDEVMTYHEIDVVDLQYPPKSKAPPYINRHTIVGNLGRDAKFFPKSESGNVKVVFSTASTRTRKVQGGGSAEETVWFDHVLLIKHQYEDQYRNMLTKGATVWISGRHDVTRREVEGETKYFPEIFVSEVKDFPVLHDHAGTSDAASQPLKEKPAAVNEYRSAFLPASFDS